VGIHICQTGKKLSCKVGTTSLLWLDFRTHHSDIDSVDEKRLRSFP
jgi:hypothetical protein